MTTKTTKDEKMNDYLIINEAVNSEHFEKSFKDVSEAKHWIINHLDTSKEWKILPATKKIKMSWNSNQLLSICKTLLKRVTQSILS